MSTMRKFKRQQERIKLAEMYKNGEMPFDVYCYDDDGALEKIY